jgi:predicted GNAT family acetyltransferase
VVFKAELGAVTTEVTQVQGVWMNPSYRGLGLSAGYMAAVVLLAQKMAPVTSLYVNDYNSRARATYERVGFRQVGTFATVLF